MPIGLYVRIFLALLMATIPPLLALVGVVLLGSGLVQRTDPSVLAASLVPFAAAWAAMATVLLGRVLREDLQTMIAMAERGRGDDNGDETRLRADQRRLAGSLDERNRQVADLFTLASAAPIGEGPREVAAHVVTAVRTVLRDPTWRLVVLSSGTTDRLPQGVYASDDPRASPSPLTDLEHWAAVSGEGAGGPHQVEGPWGAFVVARLGDSEELRALLYAPWEGRAPTSTAAADLITLVAQQASTVIEHALLYARVKTQSDELNRMAALQADFLRGITHDLQTPLTSIGALASELRSDQRLPGSARADLDGIAHGADRLRRMVGQLLVVSRLEAGALTPRQDVFAAEPIVRRVWDALRAGRQFEISATGGRQLVVGDPDRLEQVLWAVLDNAVKYSPSGSRISVEIGSRHDERIQIAVTDEGHGMDEETRRRAFEQFYRAPVAQDLAPDGSGIGLFAAQGLMRAMDGEVRIDSRLGKGTTVILDLPAEMVLDEADAGAGAPASVNR